MQNAKNAPRGPNAVYRLHPCDYAGKPAAEILAEALRAQGQKVVLFEAPTFREEGDLNRYPSHDREFHRWWQEEMDRGKRICLLDIHSYDDIDSFDQRWPVSSVMTILDTVPERQNWTAAQAPQDLGRRLSTAPAAPGHVGADLDDRPQRA